MMEMVAVTLAISEFRALTAVDVVGKALSCPIGTALLPVFMEFDHRANLEQLPVL